MKLPPALSATPATEQAVQDLLGCSAALGQFILSLPPSPERDRAIVMCSEAILWAHQAVIRAAGGRTVLVAGASELPS